MTSQDFYSKMQEDIDSWKLLLNEKYAGDVLLQKTYTVDFLTKKI